MQRYDEFPYYYYFGQELVQINKYWKITYLVDLTANGALHRGELYRIVFGVKTSTPGCNDFFIERIEGGRRLHVYELLESSHIFLRDLRIGVFASRHGRRDLLLPMLSKNLDVLVQSARRVHGIDVLHYTPHRWAVRSGYSPPGEEPVHPCGSR